nr:MAG TPA: hypothetical protein [Caudoviricetes sp.]
MLIIARLLIFAKGKQSNLPISAFLVLQQAVQDSADTKSCKTIPQVQLCRLIN